jgi:hypothetical protein
MITKNEILMGRDATHPLSPKLVSNLEKLLACLNKFQNIYGKPMVVSSGYRPSGFNSAAGGAKRSNHIQCLACDFVDTDSALDSFCVGSPHVLESCGLFLEHPKWTNGWCHLQCVTPASGKRIFVPSTSNPAPNKLDILFSTLKI